MQKLHSKLPARQSFISDADLRLACLAFDKDKSNKLEGEELRALFKSIFGFDIWSGKPVQQEYTFPQFKVVLEDMHRRFPNWNVAGKLMKWAREHPTVAALQKQPKVDRPPIKKALLIGINYIGTSNELGGCINDVRSEWKTLTNAFGFPEENIMLLSEDQNDSSKLPTCANMRKGLRWLLDGVQAGDQLFFAYSGHGAQVADASCEEEDGQDECLCPLDCVEPGGWPKNLILDDELNELFTNQLPEGVKCLCIYDCCHSASMEDLSCTFQLRSETGAAAKADSGGNRDIKGRFMPPPEHAQRDLAAVREKQVTQDAKPRKLAENTGSGSKQKLMVISGCQDNQTSADATINGKRQGALTWALMKALMEHDYVMSYDDLLVAVRANLRAGGYTQIAALSSTCESNFADRYLGGPQDQEAAHRFALAEKGYGAGASGEMMNVVANAWNTGSNLLWGGIFLIGLAIGALFKH